MQFGGTVMAYQAKKQSTLAKRSTETEFITVVHAVDIAKYIRWILLELGYRQVSPRIIYEGNQAVILMANVDKPTVRNRHIDIQLFALHEWRRNGDATFKHILGVINITDALTKPLRWVLHHCHTANMICHLGSSYTDTYDRV